MAKKKDNGEAQKSTFPPAPTLVDAPEIPTDDSSTATEIAARHSRPDPTRFSAPTRG